jgi:hypothetical protein
MSVLLVMHGGGGGGGSKNTLNSKVLGDSLHGAFKLPM